MKTTVMVSFDSDEQETFSRLNPYRSALGTDDDDKDVFGRLLSRVLRDAPRHVGPAARGDTEPLSIEFLDSFEDALAALYDLLIPEADAEWWRGRVPELTSEDALQGLAAGRAAALDDIDAARQIVADAARLLAGVLVAAGTAEIRMG